MLQRSALQDPVSRLTDHSPSTRLRGAIPGLRGRRQATRWPTSTGNNTAHLSARLHGARPLGVRSPWCAAIGLHGALDPSAPGPVAEPPAAPCAGESFVVHCGWWGVSGEHQARRGTFLAIKPSAMVGEIRSTGTARGNGNWRHTVSGPCCRSSRIADLDKSWRRGFPSVHEHARRDVLCSEYIWLVG